MLYQGKAVSLAIIEGGVAKLCFDLEGESVNKINQLMLAELKDVLAILQNNTSIKGLLYVSAKPVFIVGADITEFGTLTALPESELADAMFAVNQLFNGFEDLPFPSVAAVNGFALGGGLEIALLADYRVMATVAKIGFPEVGLGIIPGYGGTVRASRLMGAEKAIEWIAAAKNHGAEDALQVGLVDSIVDVDDLAQAASDLLAQLIDGSIDVAARKQEKQAPLAIDMSQAKPAFDMAKSMVAKQAGPHYPAPLSVVTTIESHVNLPRDEALRVESNAIAKLFKTEVSKNLIGIFLGDQILMKTAKTYAAKASPVKQAAVLGAGIMGGGIAFQSASTGTPIVMKDIAQQGIDMGMTEADGLLSAQVSRGRLTEEKKAAVLANIKPTLDYKDLSKVDTVVEAVVENVKVKKIVLAEVEGLIDEHAILASNTSTIRITELATALQRPENFCGMHFFNPVHKMPLVEIIRGEKTSEEAVAKAVNYALAMKKKPVVVNDCPGFLVNRVLFAYFAGFVSLLREGVSYTAIDKAAEDFGWPMGPAYLCDVIGIDTSVHAARVMAEGFPDRMAFAYQTVLEVLYEAGRFGEKNGKGFYRYEKDERGRNKKLIDEDLQAIIAGHIAEEKVMPDEEIVRRLMIPFAMESVRCLEENIAASATELDMAMINALGFPPFKGGIIRYVDNMGVATFCELATAMAELGALYQPTNYLLAMAAKNESFY